MRIGFLLPTLFASKNLFPGTLGADLVNGLVGRGHEVYIFSTPDFKTNGKLYGGDIEGYKKKLKYFKLYRVDGREADIRNDEVWKRSFEISVSTSAYQWANEKKLDIIHAFHDFLFIPHYLNDLTGIATVYTLHDPLPPDKSFEYHEFEKFKRHNFVSISDAQRRSDLKLNFVDTVYNGINVDNYVFGSVNSGYLLFMGRMRREKGLHNAIKAAIKSNLPLEIGTNFPDFFNGDDYFETEIKPYLDNRLIHEPGMVKDSYKLNLYQNAKALLFPIEWEEPFGMVMTEAMACGTPVIAYTRGSVPEIVIDGETGFLVNESNDDMRGDWIIKKTGLEGLVLAINKLKSMSESEYIKMRENCREHVKKKFSVEKMAADYEKVYKKVLKL